MKIEFTQLHVNSTMTKLQTKLWCLKENVPVYVHRNIMKMQCWTIIFFGF